MRIEFISATGQKFQSKDTNELDSKEAVEEFAQQIYDNLPDLNKFKMTLEDGTLLLIPKVALQAGMLRVIY